MTEWAMPQPRWLLLRARIRHATGRNDAEDLLQSAVVRFLERGPGNVRNTEAYLVRSARNIAIDAARREQNTPVRPVPTDDIEHVPCHDPRPDDALLAQQQLQKLRKGCERLDARTREVFLLHRLEDLSYKDIARRLNISVSAVEKHISRALCFLTEWMMD